MATNPHVLLISMSLTSSPLSLLITSRPIISFLLPSPLLQCLPTHWSLHSMSLASSLSQSIF
jgi:hypothetical protein